MLWQWRILLVPFFTFSRKWSPHNEFRFFRRRNGSILNKSVWFLFRIAGRGWGGGAGLESAPFPCFSLFFHESWYFSFPAKAFPLPCFAYFSAFLDFWNLFNAWNAMQQNECSILAFTFLNFDLNDFKFVWSCHKISEKAESGKSALPLILVLIFCLCRAPPPKAFFFPGCYLLVLGLHWLIVPQNWFRSGQECDFWPPRVRGHWTSDIFEASTRMQCVESSVSIYQVILTLYQVNVSISIPRIRVSDGRKRNAGWGSLDPRAVGIKGGGMPGSTKTASGVSLLSGATF